MRSLLSLFLSLIVINLSSQGKVDLRLLQVANHASQSCYDLELSSPFKEEIKLAGQNYRIFYNAEKATVLKESIKDYSSDKAYSALDIINTEQGEIGFLSLSIDARVYNDQTTIIPKDGTWTTVASACFKKLSNDSYDLVWANDRTLEFASAKVALSEWKNSENQVVLPANMMIDYIANHSLEHNQSFEMSIYPNPVVDHIKVDIGSGLSDNHSIIIKDVIGREVAYENLGGNQELYYDLSNWPSGRYTVEVIDQNGGVLHTESVIKTYDNR